MEIPIELATSAASFPVLFFDGYEEVNIGDILVHPSQWFELFTNLISQKLGIPPRMILIYLVRRHNAGCSSEIRLKVPMDENFDFNAFNKERDCFILAILKRFRRTRLHRCCERGAAIAAEARSSVPKRAIVQSILANALNVELPIAVGLRHWNFENQPQGMQMEREEAAATEKNTKTETVKEPETATSSVVVCKDCEAVKEEGRLPDYHLWCPALRWTWIP